MSICTIIFVRAHVDCNYIKLLAQCLLFEIVNSFANFRTTVIGQCFFWECPLLCRVSLTSLFRGRWQNMSGMLLSAAHYFLISIGLHFANIKPKTCAYAQTVYLQHQKFSYWNLNTKIRTPDKIKYNPTTEAWGLLVPSQDHSQNRKLQSISWWKLL